MKSTVKILFAALVLCVCACAPQGDGSISTVEVNGHKMFVTSLEKLNSDTAIVALSSLVEDCMLTQLETVDEAFFRPWFTTVSDKYIGVRQSGRAYKLFNRSGKYLCDVGSVGQGPGEYNISPYDDIIDDQNERIYLAPFMSDKILVYNTSGKFLKNIVAPQRLLKAKIFLSDNILTVIHMPFSDSKAMVYQFDVNTGNVLNEFAPQEHFIVFSADGEIFNTRNVESVYEFLHTGSDTLYRYDMDNNEILPLFTMEHNLSEPPFRQYYLLNEHTVLTHISGMDNTLGRFVSKGLVASDLKSKTSSYIKVVNDFYGNMPVPLNVTTCRNGYFVQNLQPEQLMDEIENHLAAGRISENDRQALTKTLSTLKENTNNVVFAGKLRKEFKAEQGDMRNIQLGDK
jgi:hypothetical protein